MNLPDPRMIQLVMSLRGGGVTDAKVMGALDSDIHKLLGTEYKRYRTVQHAQHELHSASKKGPPAATVTSPPPPATKKKSSSALPGKKLSSKKKATSSTTVG